jgi:vancomycin resistance protein YoaR
MRQTHFTLLTSVAWFLTGAGLGLFFSISFLFITFQLIYKDVIYPGIFVQGIDLGGKTREEAKLLFETKNTAIANTQFTFTLDSIAASASADTLGIGYNSELLADQAFLIGRSDAIATNIALVLRAYFQSISLSPSYTLDENALREALAPLIDAVYREPVDALFSFENGKVSAFRPSREGTDIDREEIRRRLLTLTPDLLTGNISSPVSIEATIKSLPPAITTEDANDRGIKERIGLGTSLFQGSIQSRIHNVTLAATRLNGILVPPGEVFSFAKAIGDISRFTGYQQAYIISGGRTILGDGGGVCQVSTTLFRAVLNAGLPILERHGHAYRVGYYEQDSPPGLDASVYVPSVDFKFKNDTQHHILIQTSIDPSVLRLTFSLYGTSDGRVTTMTTPVITSQTPPPAARYIDDPSLPFGAVRQVEYAASGARTSFNRTVTRNGEEIIQETFVTSYQPWGAVYMRGVSLQ